MATNTPTKSPTEQAEQKAREERENAIQAQNKANEAGKTDEQRAADEQKAKADEADAKVQADKAAADAEATKEPTTAQGAKALSAVNEPDRLVGDHHVQVFANIPENPQLAPGLDPKAEGKVKLEITDSDNIDPLNPKVAYVHKEMVGDYLRAGWRYPVA